jgi:hypothetical protein
MPQNEVVLTDFSTCAPAEALSREPRYDLWNLIEYETAEHSGVAIYTGALFALPSDALPELSISLNVSGWHAIHVGLWDPCGPPTRPPGYGLQLKLTGDALFQSVNLDAPVKFFVVQDGFWRHADLTGKELIIRAASRRRAGLAWVRLTPLDEAVVQARWKPSPKKIVIAKFDAANFTSERDVETILAPYEQSDFRKVFLADSLDVQWLRSGVADSRTERLVQSIEARRIPPSTPFDGCRSLWESGRDALDLLGPHLLQRGMSLYAGLRLSRWCPSPMVNHMENTSPFYTAHPEWRCRDRDGIEIPNMSYAFPEVRDYVVSLYRSLIEDHPGILSGLTLFFVRGPVFLLYEQPAVEAFRKETGTDPCALDPNDETWLSFRARYMTEFLRAMRRLCADYTAPDGKPLELAANVLCSRGLNLRFGLDLEVWAQERLVDLLIPMAVPWPDANEDFEPGYFAELQRLSGGSCRVCVQPPKSPPNMARLVHSYYEAGLDGVFFWDTRNDGLAGFGMMRRLGDPDEVRYWAEQETRSFLPRDSSGAFISVKYPDDRGEGSGRPGGDFGWTDVVPPTRCVPIEKLAGYVLSRHWKDTGS